MMGGNTANSPTGELLEILSNPRKAKKVLQEMADREKSIKSMLEQSGKVKNIDKLLLEAETDAKRALEAKIGAQQTARKTVEDAQYEAQKILAETGITVESLKIERQNFQEFMTDTIKEMDAREKKIKAQEIAQKSRADELNEVIENIRGAQEEIERKKAVLAQL